MSDSLPNSFLEANEIAKREILASRAGAERWVGSPFEWIMALPSRTRGKAGELLVENWLSRLGYSVTRPRNSGHDRIADGRKLEIKFSTLWTDQDRYVFQQLRDQDYEFVFLLGISPHIVHGWFVPKQIAFDAAVPQHGGSEGTDTRWLSFSADFPPSWMDEYGGPLEECSMAVGRLL